MNPEITLFDLMRLNEGQVTELESRSIRQAISNDPQLSEQWRKLRDTHSKLLNASVIGYPANSPAEETATDTNSEANQISRFLEQSLKPAEAKRFEQKCWEQEGLLCEVLDCYLAIIEIDDSENSNFKNPDVGQGASQSSIYRFEQLFSQSESGTVPGPSRPVVDSSNRGEVDRSRRIEPGSRGNNGVEQNGVAQNGFSRDSLAENEGGLGSVSNSPEQNGSIQPQAKADPNNGQTGIAASQHPDDPDSTQIEIRVQRDSEQPGRRSPRFNSRTSQAIWWSTTALVLVILIAWISFSFPASDDSKTVEEEGSDTRNRTEQINPSQDKKHKSDSRLNHNSEEATFEKDKLSQDSPLPREPEQGPGSGIVQKVPESNLPDKKSKQNPAKDKSQHTIPERSQYAENTELGWRRIKGLVAVKQRNETIWSSTNKQTSFASRSQFKTLPGSWAEAKTASDSVLVIDEDSSIVLSSDRKGKRFNVELMHGKAGFRSVPNGVVFEVSVAGSLLNVEALEDGTEFGIDHGEEGAHVFVRKGTMRINNTDVPKGMEGTPESPGNSEFYFAKIKSYEDVRWLSKSQSKSTIPVQLRSNLIDSKDLEADLMKLLKSKNKLTKAAAVKCRLAIDNGASLMRLVNSGDPTWRLAALEWLLELPVHDKRTKRIWRMAQDVATRTLNPSNSPNLSRWQQLSWKANVAWPDREVAQMKRLLDHREWFLRALAFYYLEKKFGNEVGYHPDLGARPLRAAAQALRRSVDAKHQLLKKSNR